VQRSCGIHEIVRSTDLPNGKVAVVLTNITSYVSRIGYLAVETPCVMREAPADIDDKLMSAQGLEFVVLSEPKFFEIGLFEVDDITASTHLDLSGLRS